jgi:hypothetical protein
MSSLRDHKGGSGGLRELLLFPRHRGNFGICQGVEREFTDIGFGFLG